MGISTHVLDVEMGRPAAGVAVRLEFSADGGVGWSRVRDGVTDGDGRCRTLVPDGEMAGVGTYRVRFATAAFYTETGREGLYPYVEIVFAVRDERHYHIPLLLTANGYSTYRGS